MWIKITVKEGNLSEMGLEKRNKKLRGSGLDQNELKTGTRAVTMWMEIMGWVEETDS